MFYALIVFIGSGIGGALRYGVYVGTVQWFGTGFPWGTFIVNIVGSFVMGMLGAAFVARIGLFGQPEWRIFLTTGVLGGFTTFSAFTLDTIYLYERGEALLTAFYVAGSVVLSLIAVFAGLWLVRTLAG